jgi:hypothetical protein
MRRWALILLLLPALLSADAAAEQADPSSVTVAVTRNWGPFTGLLGHHGESGRTTVVWLLGNRTAGLPNRILVESGGAQETTISLTAGGPAPGVLPAGTAVEYRLGAGPDVVPGRYQGVVGLAGDNDLTATVLVQDGIWWAILIVLAGAVFASGLRRLFAKFSSRRRLRGAPPAQAKPDPAPAGRADTLTVSVVAAGLSSFTYVLGLYGGHTFGNWSDYLGAFAAGAAGHVVAHAFNQTGTSAAPA